MLKNEQKLLFVSNRLPITIQRRKKDIKFIPSIGGLATGLGSFYKTYNSLWIGWCGITKDDLDKKSKDFIAARLRADFKSHTLYLTKKDIDQYYYGFCNKTIWPLFHYFTHHAIYDKDFWGSYQKINQYFCKEILKIASDNDIIWIHDYHLMLLPHMLREKLPESQIGFYLHIPFPSFEIFRLLPWRKEILEGLLGSDLIGFHTYDYVRHFLSSVRRLLGCEHTLGQVSVENRLVKVDAFPMGIDYDRFSKSLQKKNIIKEINKRKKQFADKKIILSLDRMDYTKGILERLEAFDLFLETYPDYKEKITLILIAVPSRTEVQTYMELKSQVDEMVGRINGKYGSIDWIPVRYMNRSFPFEKLIPFYNMADIALITPLRDGMNLIAKEYIATKTDKKGVLILSEMAGAARELGESLIVNPNNKQEVAQAIFQAINMTSEDQKERNAIMQNRLERYHVKAWAQDFLDRLIRIKKIQGELYAKVITPELKDHLIHSYRSKRKRLILLDYDGTLTPFFEKPEQARPNIEILELLKKLARDPKNELVILSGREKEILDNWFSKIPLGMSAEHGVWIKGRGKKWHLIEQLRNEWKNEIRSLMELYVNRTPGSFLEEKDYSLVWHYRKADPEFAMLRLLELKDDLLHFTHNLNIGLLEGTKTLEVKNAGINKGRAAMHWISGNKWDFIMAIGDDWTDEDIFISLPESAFSIRVGLYPTRAKYTIDSVTKVLSLLKKL
ncbi:MAG: bifunctional alpha,alpha-trehalose-phosphate synthase (UDP-forming)/trehalose-phosphatase [Spirochaetes bacterium]|nr:bifunctional alpha,alpha-trehalose-phosphate synthase (UDP-forming)/trehalose-phosphatase [Spirochaetota bacterium]